MESETETIETTNPENKMRLFWLLKFGEEEHLKNLREKGILYFSSIQKLRQADDFRNDTFEGITSFTAHPEGTAEVHAVFPDGTKIPINYINLSYSQKHEFVTGNITSFYAINSPCFKDNELIPVDARMQEFGTHVILITNVQKFFERLQAKLEELNFDCSHDLVKYFDEKAFTEKITPYHKRSMFKYQNEFRVFIDSRKLDSMTIELGSLEDISVIALSSDIHKLKMRLDDTGEIATPYR